MAVMFAFLFATIWKTLIASLIAILIVIRVRRLCLITGSVTSQKDAHRSYGVLFLRRYGNLE